LDNGHENLSPDIKDYFQRIINASKRMQNLITALLNYSRANNTEITFVLTDLNSIVEEVKNNLHELVEEENVTIETSELPALNVIPVQFNQLFSNIILNAIKYKKLDVNPVIKISAEIVSAREIQMQAAFANDKYWKIIISDNGIGFEQQFANKIFELFQRLHGKSDYEGTGIGLAICKKIVQNHHGFIEAAGIPGIGSTFNIYLPADK
jgi:light-regulated signal transduction histidine kinase (bacteriophytochrome)